MSNTNLIPEQRPDKNGNIVTRWVRGMFKAKESTRAIPKVTLDVSPVPPAKNEDKELYRQLMTALEDEIKKLDGIDTAKEIFQRKVHDRSFLSSKFELGEYHLLPLFKRFGSRHRYNDIAYAAGIFTAHGEDADSLTDEKLAAYASFRAVMRKEMLKAEDEGRLPTVFGATTGVAEYVLLHPEDGPVLEEIIGRGLSDKQEIFDMLRDIKAGQLQPSISDGFL